MATNTKSSRNVEIEKQRIKKYYLSLPTNVIIPYYIGPVNNKWQNGAKAGKVSIFVRPLNNLFNFHQLCKDLVIIY